MKIDKSVLGVAGELAVASELCRRNIYAQLTFGNQKRTDLLVIGRKGICKIEVKCKQSYQWPQCKGISDSKSFLVFVNYQKKEPTERPDFFVLSYNEWLKLINNTKAIYEQKHPDRRVEIEKGVLIFWDEKNKYGKEYRGHAVSLKEVEQYRDKWDKIINHTEALNESKMED